jgi:hypothetical protein
MHTAVLALGIILILSELGAIGFMLINTIRHVTEPKAAVHLVTDKKLALKKAIKVTVIENEKAGTTLVADPAEKHPDKGKPQAGYFSLVP